VIWTDSYKDELVSINIVTSMMTATLIYAAFALGEQDAMRRDLEALPGLMQQTITQAWEQADEMGDFFAPMRPAYILARGASAGPSYCARLVLEEVARYPAVSLGAGEFRQGPIEVVDDRFAAMIFVPAGPLGQLNLSLGHDILNSEGRVLFVGDTAPIDHPLALTQPIQGVADALRPVLEVIPAQVLSYKLAEMQGYTPGSVRYISKVITTEEGIPRLQAS
jgi:glucosamine--fructose-6-phosphate aminotransferase (isomerizing)